MDLNQCFGIAFVNPKYSKRDNLKGVLLTNLSKDSIFPSESTISNSLIF